GLPDTDRAGVARLGLIVATLAHALGHDPPGIDIVGVTAPSRESSPRYRRQIQRNLINPTRGRKKKAIAQGLD
ncbi:hypothetical protein OS493_038144, partial [Desmophyllum pertusum]